MNFFLIFCLFLFLFSSISLIYWFLLCDFQVAWLGVLLHSCIHHLRIRRNYFIRINIQSHLQSIRASHFPIQNQKLQKPNLKKWQEMMLISTHSLWSNIRDWLELDFTINLSYLVDAKHFFPIFIFSFPLLYKRFSIFQKAIS